MAQKSLPPGVVRRGRRLLAVASVRVNGERFQKSKMFDAGTDPDKIAAWQFGARLQLKVDAPIPATGTLAADIENYTKTDWLSKKSAARQRLATIRLKRVERAPIAAKPRAEITVEDIREMLAGFHRGGLSGPSCNRIRQELCCLWQAYDGKGLRGPAAGVEKYPESAPRKGFFERETFDKLRDALPPDYRDVVDFAYFSGWRRSEVQGLTWDEVDLRGRVVRLSQERSKNQEGRVLPLDADTIEMLKRRLAARGELPLVFTRRLQDGRHEALKDWRKAWKAACKAAGCVGALLHDFRRTVVRDLTRSGTPDVVAMKITGHRTRSVFDRYNIVSDLDLREAVERRRTRDRKPAE